MAAISNDRVMELFDAGEIVDYDSGLRLGGGIGDWVSTSDGFTGTVGELEEELSKGRAGMATGQAGGSRRRMRRRLHKTQKRRKTRKSQKSQWSGLRGGRRAVTEKKSGPGMRLSVKFNIRR
jgi:hypothetical protein